MVKESPTLPLLEELIKRSRLPWRWAIIIVAVVWLLFLILVTYLDGAFSSLSEWEFWRIFLGSPVIIIYILIVYPFMQRLGERAVQAFQSLLPIEDDEAAVATPAPNRRWEWTAIFLGLAFWLGLERPWLWVDQWLDFYASVTTLSMFVLLSWLIYNGLSGTRFINKLSRQHLKIEIFDTELVPVARYSMGITFAFIGGISLSLIFQSIESLLAWQSIVTYSILVSVTVLLFFLSMWSTHNIMAGAKKRELDLAQIHLEEATRELREAAVEGRSEGIDRLYSAVAAWGIYERRVREAPEWPYNASILRRLSVSVLIPGIVYLIKILNNLGLGL
ncbi:MAG: hypothetical protein JSV77_10330 [Dehalococcoidales bacterium]|nr:MAG: hypothetical protein JSV77_10330 [Dehalococcoidales bacterium]